MKRIEYFKQYLKSSKCPRCGAIISHPGAIHVCS